MAADSDELVSVVIATNRSSPYLSEALRSAEEQTYRRFEMLLVDDGSPDPDALQALCAAFPRVRVIRQEHAGVSIARNVGVMHAAGGLVAFLDDDDRWHPERLARHVDVMNSNPDAVVSYCGMRTIDAAGRELVAADQRPVADVHEVLRRRVGILAPNIVIRRRTFQAVGGFPPAFVLAEDLDLVLNAARMGDFAFVEGALVDYRHHSANNTARHHELARNIDAIVRQHLESARQSGREDFVSDHRESLAANQRFAAWGAARAARRFLRHGQVLAAAQEVVWVVTFAPQAPLSWLRKRLRGIGQRGSSGTSASAPDQSG